MRSVASRAMLPGIRQRRCGLSLLELLVVVSLMGIFASAAFMRFGRDIFGDSGARSEARLLSMALLSAQRAAILTGDSHGVSLKGTTADVSGWTVLRKQSDGSDTIVDGPHVIANEVDVSTTRSELWFDFEGSGSESLSVALSGENRQFAVEVEPLTRMITSQETTP